MKTSVSSLVLIISCLGLAPLSWGFTIGPIVRVDFQGVVTGSSVSGVPGGAPVTGFFEYDLGQTRDITYSNPFETFYFAPVAGRLTAGPVDVNITQPSYNVYGVPQIPSFMEIFTEPAGTYYHGDLVCFIFGNGGPMFPDPNVQQVLSWTFKHSSQDLPTSGLPVLPPLADWTGGASGELSETSANYRTGQTMIDYNITRLTTSIVGLCNAAPTVAASVTPNNLWPPNGRQVTVTLSGKVTEPSGCTTSDASFQMTDSEGTSLSGPITVGADGTFTAAIPVTASRLGSDLAGRSYTFTVSATNQKATGTSAAAVALVPHDRRK